uniref:SH3 domain-containing YSC84-like protein 1 n=1 Tax=Bos taurus TaxID=9913 RepID=A0AAA9T039_BOVIN
AVGCALVDDGLVPGPRAGAPPNCEPVRSGAPPAGACGPAPHLPQVCAAHSGLTCPGVRRPQRPPPGGGAAAAPVLCPGAVHSAGAQERARLGVATHVIAKAKGLAILSVIKAGFLVTARGGSGIVLARLPDGKWSAPSAIGIAGLGGGFELGIEVSDLVIILNYDRAVEAFAKGGNLTLGGNLTVAVGPLGRNLEGNVSLRSSAAVFTYCKSRGLFAGISLEGSCLIERKETNRKFYCQDIRAYDILFGDITRPAQAEDLYEVLDSFTEKYEIEGQRVNARRAAREQKKASAKLPPKPSSRPEQSSAQVQLSSGSQSSRNEYNLYPELSSYRERVGNSNQPIEVTALYSFEGQQPGDLNFQAGDRITVISKTDSHFDWWEGKLRGRTGIFPANYVTMN